MALAAAPSPIQTSISAVSQILPQKLAASAFRPPLLGRIGSLTVRLAETALEIEAALVLRYQVFFAERGGTPNVAERRDADHFDDLCDHLLVFDESLPGPTESKIVGTYRLLREEHSLLAGGFYSEAEYDVHGLVNRHKSRRFLELGRSCVLPQYRSKRTVELLWQGIWAYCRSHAIDVMFGCASFAGTISAKHALPLSFLHHHARETGAWRVKALDGRGSPMDLMPAEAINIKSALLAMPPLIKGYLRLGAKFGEHAVVDNEFGTTDVFVIVRTEEISERYLNHYGPEATRFA
jgi:putative hemolysin